MKGDQEWCQGPFLDAAADWHIRNVSDTIIRSASPTPFQTAQYFLQEWPRWSVNITAGMIHKFIGREF